MEYDGKVSELAKLVAEAKSKKEAAKLEADKASKDYEKLAKDLLSAMELQELESFVAHGFTFYSSNRDTVSMPKEREAKEELLNFLTEKELFWDYVTVNSQSLNSLYKSLAEQAAEEMNFDFRLPGVGAPSSFKTLGMRKKN